ncbi:MAG: right-handed parallel beta-helix repeat-containing protein [Pirellulaceae bacterium]|nr:right-handed parallel beta-helix repeat-containing protein [Pirellulaceae bacterium]
MNAVDFNRRKFVLGSASLLSSGLVACKLLGQDPPPVTDPRATSGDDTYEPNWDEQLTLTVGTQKADLVGTNERVIQAAVDYVARLGGGTVKILPGTYHFRNSVYLASGVRIVGSGPESILLKEPSIKKAISADSDWYDQEITLQDAEGFRVGDGVCLQTKNPHNSGTDVLKRTLVAQNGNRFKLDKALRKNYWLSGEPTCASLFPLFSGEFVEHITLENITFDGNLKNNENLNGNYGGCIWLQDCRRISMRNLETRNYNGDGISWQICHDVLVENCHSHDNGDLGLHPGSGSQRPVMIGNKLERNGIGIFWCWGVKYGLAENNQIHDTTLYGISIGHNDTDNVMRNNLITGSGRVGILFRDDCRGKDFWANRNRIENNQVIDSGGPEGVAIDVQGETKDVSIANNEIRETREPQQRIGIRLSALSESITLKDNRIEGFATPLQQIEG